MRTIIAGSRSITAISPVIDAIHKCGWEITEVVCGMADGVDSTGLWWAERVAALPVKRFPADWEVHGKAAGPIRNKQMAEYAEALILVWDGKSKGSADMLRRAQIRNLRIYQHIIP